ncbi:MAG: acetoacetate--CoA ligase [Legionellales bacterium RIFCSPHIGHO2_12_FULL_37_14]|nr:MAG: acetoacetate--CoA ligase [Legionellales bacterium RIFCSPHIGHO2_12_FULL_37_14]
MNMTIMWQPKDPQATRLYAFWQYIEKTHEVKFTDYQALHAWSVRNFPLFWQAIADFFSLPWVNKPSSIFNKTGDYLWQNQWFKDATFNIAEVMLRGQPNQLALVSINEHQRHTLTYAELKQSVGKLRYGLKASGVQKGDRIAAIMPNTAETIIAMLASASIGAIFASCSPDFGTNAIVDRFSQIKPKILFICDGQYYNGKTFNNLEKIPQLLEQLPTLEKVVVCPIVNKNPDCKNLAKTILLAEFTQTNEPFTAVALPFSHPLYIMFSSGTTGKPKCIVHAAGNILLQHLKEHGLHCNFQAHDNILFYSTCGWMMWNWMVSGLSLGATLTLFDGAPFYPSVGKIWEIIEREKITALGVGAKYLASVEQELYYPKEKHNLDTLKIILSTGSPLLSKQFDFVYSHIKEDLQLSSISGGTDILSCFVLGNPMLPVFRGEIQCAGLGMDMHIFNEHGEDIVNTKGELVCTTPFPSMPLGFLHDEDNKLYQKTYFSKFNNTWTQGDFAEQTSRHTFIIYGRSDTTLNPKGVRIGTAEIYREVEQIPEVIESVVIGQNFRDDIRVILFVKLKPKLTLTKDLQQTIKTRLKTNASPRHVPDLIVQVPDIPKTFNGKIVEHAIKQTLEGETIQNLSSIVNPDALRYFTKKGALNKS